jgi:sodium borate transporter 11
VKVLADEGVGTDCNPTKPLLELLLVLVTVYVGVVIFNFKYSPYLNADKRVVVADYALVVAATVGTVLGSHFFRKIDLGQLYVDENKPLFQMVTFRNPSVGALFAAIALGFIMSLLFFMEGNMSASIVNNPSNKLKKGTAYHHDMVVIGVINAIMSVFCLPFVHGSLPHSPLHVRALADIEEHIENGTLSERIVYVRETRLTTLISHIMIAVSVLLIPYPLNLIPIPVLYGLFVFLSLTSLGDLQLWERLVLIFTEQSLYPPIHYVRKVPQKIIHCFTFLQIVQLIGLCLITFGKSVYLKMFFPVFIILLMPIRDRVLPTLISERHLHSLDGYH